MNQASIQNKFLQKVLLGILGISICFLLACGGSSTSSSLPSNEDPTILTGPKTCYMGVKSNSSTCVRLKSIDGAKEGYLNPYTDSSFMSGANKDQYRRPVNGVDLKVTSPSLQISPHFIVSEFMSLEKGHFGILSTYVLKQIQKMRDKFGSALKINSGFRSPNWNSGIDGSAKWSRHQYGDGLDIASTKANLQKTESLCRELGATFTLQYTTHVHCDWRGTIVEAEFFGSLQNAQLAQKAVEEERSSILSNLTETSEIYISGELKAGNIILLTSKVTYTEDPDHELLKEWHITHPDGTQTQYEQREVSLPVQRGTYQILHIIGGNIELRKTFFVN